VEKIDVSVVMGSQSDWPTMKVACDLFEEFKIDYEKKIVSAHRTPDRLYQFASKAIQRKIKVIIAGAGGAAHLPGMIASKTILPVIGVPIETSALKGLDSLYSIVQMPRGFPVATMAIGEPGAFNAAILAMQLLGLQDPKYEQSLSDWREKVTKKVADEPN
jgi:5-(carboxyamino)imidazole ribonucleotide mutase